MKTTNDLKIKIETDFSEFNKALEELAAAFGGCKYKFGKAALDSFSAAIDLSLVVIEERPFLFAAWFVYFVLGFVLVLVTLILGV